MLSITKHPWRKAILQASALYAICVAVLLWLLPPPVHFHFSSERNGHQLTPTTEHALVRLTSTENPDDIQDFLIEHVDLKTRETNQIALDPGDKSLPPMRQYLQSRNGLHFLVMHKLDNDTVTIWNGLTGKLGFIESRRALGWIYFAWTTDSSRFAAYSDQTQIIDIYDTQSGKIIGNLECKEKSKSRQLVNLRFSLDDKYLFCSSAYDQASESVYATEVFHIPSMTSLHHFSTNTFSKDTVAPTPNGFWIMQWNTFNETITLTYLDAQSGQRTTLAPELSSRHTGFPHIFSDNAGHLYLLQNCKPPPEDWQKRTRQTILGWLKKLGFEWETTDEIVLRHISPDGKRLISEQTFSANYVEISPDGQYLILMSQMKNDCRYVVYHYPTRLNWKHSLLWPLIPAMLLLLLQRWRRHGQNQVDR